MPGRSLESLPWPRKQYRIDLVAGSKFETEAAAQAEDGVRARRLCNYPDRTASEQAECDRLAKRIMETDPDEFSTLASKTVMRGHRIRVGGELWRLCRGENVNFVTLIPRKYSVTPDDLMELDPEKMNKWLRMTLRRCGAERETEGWIFAYLEGEYNPSTGMIQLHWHVIMVGTKMLGVINNLRQHPAFKRKTGTGNNSDGVDKRIVVLHPDLPGLPAVISYTMKGAWYAMWRSDDEDGNRKSQMRPSRIEEPAGSKVLLWLDQWHLGDMAMLLNLRVGKIGLTRQ